MAADSASATFVRLAPGIAYVPGDIERSLTCNTGVIMGEGRITIVDAAIPAGADAAYTALRAQTNLPVVRVIDTHYHLDHTYGNAYWNERGAKPFAYAGLREELAKSEPELFGGGPGLWQKMTGGLPQLRSSRPLSPSFVKSGTTFESGADAITIIHPGIGHTHSDAVVWVPAKRALFTGDLVVNGPYNAVADSTIGPWIRVLDQLRALRPEIVVPGHGAAGGPELIVAQQHYFKLVTQEIDRAIESGRDINADIPVIHRRMLADPATARFVNDGHFTYSGFFHFHDLAAKIYHERTGKTLARRSDAPPPARCCGDLARHRALEKTA
jgi:glyoxylase-like metal-dependent hydrolase (beta-lactamase superfamily II)